MAGYSGTPLAKKLGFKSGFIVRIVNAPDHYWNLFTDLPDDIRVQPHARRDIDVIHWFVTAFSDLDRNLLKIKSQIKENGMIWISWPKKASKVATDITEDKIRKLALENGLVDVKVCAVDDVWSGLKLMMPVTERTRT